MLIIKRLRIQRRRLRIERRYRSIEWPPRDRRRRCPKRRRLHIERRRLASRATIGVAASVPTRPSIASGIAITPKKSAITPQKSAMAPQGSSISPRTWSHGHAKLHPEWRLESLCSWKKNSRRDERQCCRTERRYRCIKWWVFRDVSQCFKNVSQCFKSVSWCFTSGSRCFMMYHNILQVFLDVLLCLTMFYDV